MSLCLDEEDAKNILLNCWEARNWRLKFWNGNCLNMNKEVACGKILICTDKCFIRLFRYSEPCVMIKISLL